MIKYRKITDISLFTDTISIYRTIRVSKVLISAIRQRYFWYIDPSLPHSISGS